jgi:lipopolysaccharide transport system ATP-binding protein
MPAIVSSRDLGKRYTVGPTKEPAATYRTLRDDLARLATLPWRVLRRPAAGDGRDFWALRDVAFDVEPGEVVGVIGRNGAGKSTLLKILSRITKPTTGQVELRGRVGSLLEVGTGFHPEMTGRENIFLSGVILGMSRREVQRQFDEIVQFAEIDAFLDTPVKRYSSGMYVRLAFAVAAHLDPEILIVDEVLAVGDAAFQKKCLGKMQSLSGGGRTVFFVSHTMPAVRSLTTRCLYLRSGQVAADGPTPEVIDRYLTDAWDRRESDRGRQVDPYRRDRNRTRAVMIERLWVEGGDGGDPPVLASGEDFTVHCEFSAARALPKAYCAFWLTNQQGERAATFFTADSGFAFPIRTGRQVVACRVRGLPLGPGRYSLTLGLNEGVTTTAFDVIVDYPAFQVVLPALDTGEIDWPHRPWGCVHWPDVCWVGDPHHSEPLPPEERS